MGRKLLAGLGLILAVGLLASLAQAWRRVWP